jgi:hypothetical protein
MRIVVAGPGSGDVGGLHDDVRRRRQYPVEEDAERR